MQDEFIPVCEPLLAGNELKYVTEAVKGGWISSSGPYVGQFEKQFAKYIGVKHAVTVSNGTVAVHLALLGLGIKPGDEIIVPDFTMMGSTFPVCYLGAKPVFVDCETDTWNIDPKLIEKKITKKTKAIMPVHIYGHPCAMKEIQAIADRHGLKVIEDAAEAIGSEYNGKKCGSLSDVATFSFFANKVVTTGEGGMVTTNDDEVYERCRYFKNLCFPLVGERNYVHDEIGYNYRMPNLSAALGVAQLEKVDDYVQMRRDHARFYTEALRDVPGIVVPVERSGCINSYWMYGILLEDDFGIGRDEFMKKLREKNIETRKFFMPMHSQKSLIEYGCESKGSFPNSINLSKKGLYLPSGSGLTSPQLTRIVDTIKRLAR